MRVFVSLIVAFAVSALLGRVLIPWLRALKAGQSIKENGPTWHMSKQGTPTMGGLMFIAGILAAVVVAGYHDFLAGDFGALFVFLFALVFGIIGFIDDYMKVKYHHNEGLTAPQKFLLQLAAAIVFTVLLRSAGYLTADLFIPFARVSFPIPWPVYMAFAAFVMVGTVNAVNITDGVDGLAAGVTIPVAVFYLIVSLVRQQTELGIFSAALLGGLGAFLIYNFHPAKVLMGDTGSLFLGGAVCGMAFALDMPLVLILIGIIYLAETASDIIQVAYFKAREQQLARGPIDLPFLMLTMMLLAIGLVMLLSASSYSSLYDRAAGYKVVEGVVQLGDPMYYFKRQLVWAMLGIGAMYLVSRLNYQYLRVLALPVLGLSVILLILVLVPGLKVNVNGATRWLKLFLVAGPTYQPSEIAKLGVVLFFASRLSKRQTDALSAQGEKARRQAKAVVSGQKKGLWNRFLAFAYWSDLLEVIPYALILLLIGGLMALEPHMSGLILVMAAGAAILFAAGIRLGWFALGGGALAVLVWLVIDVIGYNSSRIDTWRNPWWDPGDKGFQVVQSLYAVASGGLSGLGFGMSRQKYLYLPEEQNDFIFAIVCEEVGFICGLLVILLFALLVIRGYWLALHARDRFGSLLIVGIITLLGVQVFLNIAVVLNVIPCTGISLPFFSYGGTALLIQLAEMGIILAASRQIPAPKQG